jgi:hypothetical protein
VSADRAADRAWGSVSHQRHTRQGTIVKITPILIATAAILALAGCTSNSTSAQGDAPVASSTASASAAPQTPRSTPTLVPRKPAPSVSALAISAVLKAKIPSVTQVVQISENKDSNNPIGRPNEYTPAATLYDSRKPCTELGVDCGATIEIWPSAALATTRVNYIQTTLKANYVLGSEYDYSHGNAVLRVAGAMKPSHEAAYLQAWYAHFG